LLRQLAIARNRGSGRSRYRRCHRSRRRQTCWRRVRRPCRIDCQSRRRRRPPPRVPVSCLVSHPMSTSAAAHTSIAGRILTSPVPSPPRGRQGAS
jgi:hypothetical protein